MKRREFIKTSIRAATASAAFPIIIPGSALGKSGAVAPSDRIVMGCIGVGGQGTYNMQAFMHMDDVQIVALCDVNAGSDDYDRLYQFPNSSKAGLEPARQRLAGYYRDHRGIEPEISKYADFRELLLRKDIDAVTVCTPDHWHGLVSLAALKAGKDVYCEKPLTNTIAEGRAVVDATRRFGRVLQTGSHERSNHSVRYAAELIRNGRIGRLHTIRVNMPVDQQLPVPPQPVMPVPPGLDYNFWLGPTPFYPYTKKRSHFWWRYILEYGGGEMTDRGAHIIDLAQLVMNMDQSGPVEIKARGTAPMDGIYDTFFDFEFEMKYENGVTLYGTTDRPRGIRFEGSDGWIFIHIHGGRLEASDDSILNERIEPGEIHLSRTEGHHRNFLDCIKSRETPTATAETGHRTGSICHLLNIAMLTEKSLIWNPVTEKITNDASADRMTARPMRSPWHL